MQCRSHCGACCIAPSISSPIPGMPNGKAAGEKCIHLLKDYRCDIFLHPSRPKVCGDFTADQDICGNTREEAIQILAFIEESTLPMDISLTPRSTK